jgi:predicted metal-dependent peptidase
LERLVPKGGGGTSFFPPFVWIRDNMLKKGKTPAFVIYFTDAYGNAPKVSQYGIGSYAQRLMWVITDNDDASNLKYGEKIYLDKLG